ncbi:MAG TPA: folylpolyglutamate synthase/dihydrofolate synthase family protein [Candidatus Polarisedimenticolaceae bacterium]|nr:folylpolyglutamate synthase/dihydrofolate synthase family protein [Candidatus Polarisedimenticolaceae bacterium]
MVPTSDPVAWLYGLQHAGVKLGLDGIRGLLALLDHPESRYPSVLVGGTNGKGSTAATLDALLLAHGRRPGLYTSPHLVRPNERIRIRGGDVDDSTLEGLLRELRARIAEGLAQGSFATHPSFFEVITAAALLAFARAPVEIAVLEVGLGGRLDATNAVAARASVIVSVDFDHMSTLGNTLAAIAGEKAGIVKPGRPVISGVAQPEARAVLERACAAASSPLLEVLSLTEALQEDDETWTVRTPQRTHAGLRPALAGAHQIHNLRVALLAFETIAAELGVAVAEDRVREGIEAVRWPGRLQRIDGNPPLLLDGAHNASGAAALARELSRRDGPAPVLLFGAMRDKELFAILGVLVARASSVVLTRPSVDRAADPAALAAALPAGVPALLEPDPSRALDLARTLARREGRALLVSGSLYLVGEVLGLLEGRTVPGPVPM